MTYKELVDDLLNVATSHKMVKEAIYSLNWEVNESIKPGRNYFLIVIVPITTAVGENLINRGFTIMCMDILSKNINNKLQIQSDCESILVEIINYIKDNRDYDIINEKNLTVFQENFGDFCAGAQVDLIIEGSIDSLCGAPFETQYVNIVDNDGNILAQLRPPYNYTVTQLTNILQNLGTPITTIIQDIE